MTTWKEYLRFFIFPVLLVHSFDKIYQVIHQELLHFTAFLSRTFFRGTTGTEVG